MSWNKEGQLPCKRWRARSRSWQQYSQGQWLSPVCSYPTVIPAWDLSPRLLTGRDSCQLHYQFLPYDPQPQQLNLQEREYIQGHDNSCSNQSDVNWINKLPRTKKGSEVLQVQYLLLHFIIISWFFFFFVNYHRATFCFPQKSLWILTCNMSLEKDKKTLFKKFENLFMKVQNCLELILHELNEKSHLGYSETFKTSLSHGKLNSTWVFKYKFLPVHYQIHHPLWCYSRFVQSNICSSMWILYAKQKQSLKYFYVQILLSNFIPFSISLILINSITTWFTPCF